MGGIFLNHDINKHFTLSSHSLILRPHFGQYNCCSLDFASKMAKLSCMQESLKYSYLVDHNIIRNKNLQKLALKPVSSVFPFGHCHLFATKVTVNLHLLELRSQPVHKEQICEF